MDEYDIIIIGSGISGLVAGYELNKKGFKVLILESESEIGGRMRSVKIEGEEFYLNAEFITTHYSYLYNLSKAFHLDLNKVNANNYPLNYKGKQIDFSYSKIFELIKNLEIDWKRLVTHLPALLGLILRYLFVSTYSLNQISKNDNLTLNQQISEIFGDHLPKLLVDPIIRSTFHYEKGGDDFSANYAISWLRNVVGGEYLTFNNGIKEIAHKISLNINYLTSIKVSKVYKRKDFVEVFAENLDTKSSVSYKGKKVIIAIQGSKVLEILDKPTLQEMEFFQYVNYSQLLTVLGKTKSNLENLNSELIESVRKIDTTVQNSWNYFNIKINKISWNNGKIDLENIIKVLPKDFEILYTHYLSEALPKFYVGYVEKIIKFRRYLTETSTSVIFCGDYLFGPYTEGAAQAGLFASSLINK